MGPAVAGEAAGLVEEENREDNKWPSRHLYICLRYFAVILSMQLTKHTGHSRVSAVFFNI